MLKFSPDELYYQTSLTTLRRLGSENPYLRIVSANLPDGYSDFGVLVFEVVADPVVFLEGNGIFRRVHTSSLSHFVSTSRRREPFCMTLPYQSWPSRLRNQLMKILVAFGCGGSFTMPRTPKAIAGRQALPGRWRRLDRQTRFDERLRLAPADAERQSDLALR